MATQGNTELYKGIPELRDAFVVIIKTEWNAQIVDELERGAISVLEGHNVKTMTIVVPGAFEVPYAVQSFHKNSKQPADAYIALATVIRGDTPHFDYVCQGITNGIMNLNVSMAVPTIFGVLTVDNQQQAQERIGGVHGHKGEEAAVTALKMIALKRSFR